MNTSNLFTGNTPDYVGKVLCKVEENFPGLSQAVDVGLSVWATSLIEDITQPTALFFVGPPSSNKTTTISIMRAPNETYFSDNFTPASFVSHMSGKDPAKLAKDDLLTNIKEKCLLTPELNTIWSQPREKLQASIGILTRIMDGDGYVSNSGVHGRRGIDEPVFFTWLGATTPLSRRIWQSIGKFGNRLYFYSMPMETMSNDAIVKSLTDKIPYKERVRACREAVVELMKQMRSQYPAKITWDKAAEDKVCKDLISEYADVLARLRCTVEREYDYYDNSEIVSVSHERPDRAAHALYNISRGHALVHGRNKLNEEDLLYAGRITFASAPPDRVKAFKLVKQKKSIRSDELQDVLEFSSRVAREVTTILEKAGLIEIAPDPTGGRGRPYNMILLNPKYRLLPMPY